MSVRIGRRQFAPRAWSVVLATIGIVAFGTLGAWQLGRARDKQALDASFAAGGRKSLDATGQRLDELPRYQHVRLRGSYDDARQILLDAMPSAASGRPGYRVLTPLARADGRGWILVDRGWVPLGSTRDELPDVTVGGDEREVRGILDTLPVPGLRAGPAGSPGDTGWPRVLLFPTEGEVEDALGVDVDPRIVLLDADLPEGFERRWRPSRGFGAQRHLAYAIQWFAFALLAAVLFIVLNLRRADADQETDPS